MLITVWATGTRRGALVAGRPVRRQPGSLSVLVVIGDEGARAGRLACGESTNDAALSAGKGSSPPPRSGRLFRHGGDRTGGCGRLVRAGRRADGDGGESRTKGEVTR